MHTHTHTRSFLSPRLSAGNDAVSAIIDYMETISHIQEALNLTATINSTLQQVQSIIATLDAENFDDEVDLALQDAQLLLSQAEALRESVANLTELYQRIESLVAMDTNSTEQLVLSVRSLRVRVNSLSVMAGVFASAVNSTVASVDHTLSVVMADQMYVMETVSQLQEGVASSVSLVDQTRDVSQW